MARNKYYDFLIKWGYRLSTNEPIDEEHPYIYEMGDKIVKVTNDLAEIKAANSLLNKENPLWAKITSIKHLDGYHVIISERLTDLSGEQITNFNKFKKKMRLIIIVSKVVSFLTFKKKQLKIDSFKKRFNDNDKEWLSFARSVIRETRKHGVEYPSDFLNTQDMGIKNGKIACFDINDQKDKLFYEKL